MSYACRLVGARVDGTATVFMLRRLQLPVIALQPESMPAV
jgi:hypothetical protein